MLQFITKGSARYSVEEETQKAIEGGCRWIQLSSAALANDETTLRSAAEKLIPLCRESNCFLVIEDDVELVDELRVHGVFLNDNTRSTVAAAREALGANAVLGVAASTAAEVLGLRGLDVDYICASREKIAEGGYRELVDSLRDAGVEFHIVAEGEFTPDELPALLQTGVSGIAVSSAIADSHNPTLATKELIEALDAARNASYKAE